MATRGFSVWFFLGVSVMATLMLVSFGILFLRTIMASSVGGEGLFTLLLLTVLVLLTGGGVLSSTISESIRRWRRP